MTSFLGTRIHTDWIRVPGVQYVGRRPELEVALEMRLGSGDRQCGP